VIGNWSALPDFTPKEEEGLCNSIVEEAHEDVVMFDMDNEFLQPLPSPHEPSVVAPRSRGKKTLEDFWGLQMPKLLFLISG